MQLLLTALVFGASFAAVCIAFVMWRIHVGRKGRPIVYQKPYGPSMRETPR